MYSKYSVKINISSDLEEIIKLIKLESDFIIAYEYIYIFKCSISNLRLNMMFIHIRN